MTPHPYRIAEITAGHITGQRVHIGWSRHDEADRYHCWFDVKTHQPTPPATVYKNPPLGLGRHDRGWFPTRIMRGDRKVWQPVVAYLTELAPALIAEAVRQDEAAEAARLVQAAQHRRANQAWQRAPGLLRLVLACPAAMAELAKVGGVGLGTLAQEISDSVGLITRAESDPTYQPHIGNP